MSNLFLLIFIICFLCVPFFLAWAFINIIRKQPTKKYFKLSGIFVLLSIISFLIFGFALDGEADKATTDTATVSEQDIPSKYDNQESPVVFPDSTSDITREENELESKKEQTEKTDDGKTTAVKSGTYNISGESFSFSDSVINDVTGKWRLSLVASSKDITEYAVDYYNTLFSSDDEIHAIVNFTLKTTTRISVLYDGMLDVTIYEYVDKEEHDANTLFSGMLLKEYFINVETGDVEELTTTTEEQAVSEIEINTIEEQFQTESNDVTEISTQNNINNSNNNFNTYNNVSQQQTSDSYVLNSGTYKFHYPSCQSVAQIAPQNYSTSNSSRSEIIAQGYQPCGRCNP